MRDEEELILIAIVALCVGGFILSYFFVPSAWGYLT